VRPQTQEGKAEKETAALFHFEVMVDSVTRLPQMAARANGKSDQAIFLVPAMRFISHS